MVEEPKIGDIVEAEVFKITDFGAFVKFAEKKGLIHISQVSDAYVKDINQHLKVGDKVRAKVININKDGKIDLSLKKDRPTPNKFESRNFRFSDFEQKLKNFLKKSQQKQIDLKRNIEAKQNKGRHR